MDMTIPQLEELNLETYLEFMKIAKDIKGDGSFNDELLTLKLLEILLNKTEEEIDAIDMTDMRILAEGLKPLLTQAATFDDTPKREVEIEGVVYVAKDFNKLDNGEYISLNLLRERFTTSYDVIPYLLAVLVRPGKKDYDFEKKEERWIIEDFNRRDVENLEWRANLFLKKAKAVDLMPIATFFLAGKEKSETTTPTSSPEA